VIGILIATVTLSFSGAQQKARDARRIEDMNSIQKAMEMYYGASDYTYATSQSALTNGGYLQTIPTDPKPSPYIQYNWRFPSNGYCVCAAVENANDGNSTDNNCTFTATSGSYYCVRNRQ